MKHLTKVFVMDDDPAVRAAVEAILMEESYDVRGFESGGEFLGQYHPTQVGCLVVDLLMLDEGGRSVLRHLQETGSLLSIVNITGLIGAAAEADDHFPQEPLRVEPFEAATLLAMVEDAIAGSIRRRANRPSGPWAK